MADPEKVDQMRRYLSTVGYTVIKTSALHDVIDAVPALQSLVRRLWACEHVAAHDYEAATFDDYTDGSWFGTVDAHRRLTEAEVSAFRDALGADDDERRER